MSSRKTAPFPKAGVNHNISVSLNILKNSTQVGYPLFLWISGW